MTHQLPTHPPTHARPSPPTHTPHTPSWTICFEDLDLDRKEFAPLSPEARAFIQALLVKDPLQVCSTARRACSMG